MPENNTFARKAAENVPNHEITIRARKQMTLSGVKEVLSFDPSLVELITALGELSVEGSGLRMGTLDTKEGIVELEGNIIAVSYSDTESERRERKNPFKRLLG